MHITCSYLHLKGDSVTSDNGGVKRLIHIGLRSRYIILETAGNALEQLMYDSESRIALKLRVNDDTDRVKVVYLIEALVLIEHLAIY